MTEVLWSRGVTRGWTRCPVDALRFEVGCIFCGMFFKGIASNNVKPTSLFALLIRALVGRELGEGNSADLGVLITIQEEI